jgi:Uma2 family endonuclease
VSQSTAKDLREAAMDSLAARRRFTVGEYERMVQAGILTEDDRVELIDGDILTMAPIGPRHAACVRRLNALLMASPVKDQFVVSVQDPISLPSAASEPQPDIALLAPPLSRYTDRHAEARDVLLLIEVADPSAADDRAKKLPVYARAGISEVWLVDLPNRGIERYRSPSPEGYADVATVGKTATMMPNAVPGLEIPADRILE